MARRHLVPVHRGQRWRVLTAEKEAAATAEIVELAAGRADVLAHVAGVLLGAGEGELDEPRKRQAAELLINAGADGELIPR